MSNAHLKSFFSNYKKKLQCIPNKTKPSLVKFQKKKKTKTQKIHIKKNWKKKIAEPSLDQMRVAFVQMAFSCSNPTSHNLV
jgi:hypothetical protein